MFGASHVNINIAIEDIPAITWFSVKLDKNIPKLIYAIEVIKNPIIVIITVGISGTLK